MPYEMRKQKGKFCVFNKETGENKGCSMTEKEAIAHMKKMYMVEHMEDMTTKMLESNGPVIVGIAATNIPHLPLPPMSVVEVNGEKRVRVPFLKTGVFKHPNGKLIFNDTIFDKMLDNHKEKKSWYGVSLNEKHKPGAALAWFDEERGGYIQKEDDPQYGKLLVGYGKPTSDKVLEMIKNQEYVFASVEFNPNHQSNLIAKLSSDDIDEISEEILLEEIKMDEVTISQEEYDALKSKAEKAEKVAELEQALADANDKVKKLEEAAKPVVENKEYSEDAKILLEQLEDNKKEIARLKRNALESQVVSIIARAEAHRDANGYAHSPVLLEIAKAAMLGEPVKITEDNIVKLESGEPADVADYFRKVFIHLLDVTPGQVRFESQTEPDNDKPALTRGEAYTQDDYKSFWAEKL